MVIEKTKIKIKAVLAIETQIVWFEIYGKINLGNIKDRNAIAKITKRSGQTARQKRWMEDRNLTVVWVVCIPLPVLLVSGV